MPCATSKSLWHHILARTKRQTKKKTNKKRTIEHQINQRTGQKNTSHPAKSSIAALVDLSDTNANRYPVSIAMDTHSLPGHSRTTSVTTNSFHLT